MVEQQTYQIEMLGRIFTVNDTAGSQAVEMVASELEGDEYRMRSIEAVSGDVICDIGGHVGLFALYCSTLFPNAQIHSFEPYPPNQRSFMQNMRRNDVKNVVLHKCAVTGDRRTLTLHTNVYNSGAATANARTLLAGKVEQVPSITLDDVFEKTGARRCKLLKIDCEGHEHEILQASTRLGSVDNLRGEFHINNYLWNQGYSIVKSLQLCLEAIPKDRIRIRPCIMSE